MNFKGKLVLSGHLSIQSVNGQAAVAHSLRRKAVKASPELLAFLDLFKAPIHPKRLPRRAMIPGAGEKISKLAALGFLVPENAHEEKTWLERQNILAGKKIFRTRHFSAFYSGAEGYRVRRFADFLEKIYHLLSPKFVRALCRPFRRPGGAPAILYVCRNREELKSLWGKALLPDHIRVFVTKGGILAAERSVIESGEYKGVLAGHMAHELTHLFLCRAGVRLPVWMTEGLCDFHSGVYRHDLFLKLAAVKNIRRFKEIEARAAHSLMDVDDAPDDRNMAYRQSESFVCYLAGLCGEEKLMDSVFKTGLSRDFRTVFKGDHGFSLDEAEEKWRKEIRRG